MVDSLEHQQLLSALQERHTFNDRAVARQAVPVKELIERSRRQHMPSWPMEAPELQPQRLGAGRKIWALRWQ